MRSEATENKFPFWLEITSFIVLLLNLPLIFLEGIPLVRDSLPLYLLEWVFTGIFTVEYITRIFLAQKKSSYVFGTWGILDFLSILPQYIILVFPSIGGLFLLRLLRFTRLLTRAFRAARTGGEALEDFLDVQEHFAPNESVIKKLRMSRVHYFFTYFFGVLLLILFAIAALFLEGPQIVGIPIFTVIAYIFFTIIAIWLIHKELYVLAQRFGITTHRILSSTSILHVHVTSVSLKQITDITLHQTFIERILDTGSLEIRTSGEATTMQLEGIRKPDEIKQLIHKDMMQAEQDFIQRHPPQQQTSDPPYTNVAQPEQNRTQQTNLQIQQQTRPHAQQLMNNAPATQQTIQRRENNLSARNPPSQ